MGEQSKNLPPQDGREWVNTEEAAAMVHLSREYFVALAREDEFTRAWGTRRSDFCWYLKSEIAKWAELRGMRRHWVKTHTRSHRYPRWTEKVDLEWARGIFIPTEEAARILGVAPITVRGLVRRGRLVCYQAKPGQRGSRLWFSRRAVEQLNEDEERAKRRAGYKQGKERCAGYGRHGVAEARMVRGIPKEWLTTREAAERLGVHPIRVREMRETGRIRGERLWRRNKPLRFWYFPVWEVEKLLADASYLEIRARWQAVQERRNGSLLDKIKMGPPKVMPGQEDLTQALRPMFTSIIWKLPPEPDWADKKGCPWGV